MSPVSSGRGRRAALLGAVAAIGVGVLTGCSGVPRSSVPQPVRTLVDGGNPTPELTVRPEPSDDSRTTVDKFLQANVSKDEKHPTARTFLTAAAAGKWQDSTVTVVDDYRVGVLGANGRLPVTGRVVGTLDPAGVYSPTLLASGRTAERTFEFSLVQEKGQWRISDPPPGLVIRQSDFESAYRRRPLYFFDEKELRLVPDLRYSAAEQQSLASWLLARLIAGPQPALQPVVRNEFPDQLESDRAKVTLNAPDVNGPVKIQLPGLAQAEAPVATRVAAQIAYTFYSFQATQPITMLDGPATVRLGASLPEQFTRDTFASVSPESTATPQLYYLRKQALVGPTGTAVVGPAGSGRPPLQSVAVSGSAPDLTVAAITAAGNALLKGPASAALRSVRLPVVATTRPEFRPGAPDEVWVGGATALMQVVGATVRRVPVAGPTGPPPTASGPSGQQLRAVRFSPDGTRVALVYAGPTTSSVWVGGVGAQGPVSVEGIRQITPQDWAVTDVAWSDSLSLRAIGKQRSSDDIEIWSCYADGSGPQYPSAAGLPGTPDAVAAGSGVSTVVSAGGTLWREQAGGGWENAFTADRSDGTAPTFAG